MTDPLDTLEPEIVVDLLAPVDTFGDGDYAAFVRDLDAIRELNWIWLELNEDFLRAWVESAEVY